MNVEDDEKKQDVFRFITFSSQFHLYDHTAVLSHKISVSTVISLFAELC